MTRTHEEIVEKLKEKQEEFMSFWPELLIGYLPFDHAKSFLKEGVKEEDWEKDRISYDREHILEVMRDYMVFAWGKVEAHRGLSAGRSVDKFEAWTWFLGDDLDLESISFENYGAPKLAKVCEFYGFSIPNSMEVENMRNSQPCELNCNNGCGV